jgi:archaellum biogenesis ATPase FlaH
VDTWLNCLTFSSRESLLEKILQQVKETIQTILQEKDNSSNRTISSRPIVIIIDSLNALLQQNLTKDVVHFIKQLRKGNESNTQKDRRYEVNFFFFFV